jgi:hypothetical protein
MSQSFEIISEDRREYRRYNTVGTQLIVRLNPRTNPGTANPVNHIAASMNELFEHALKGAADSDNVEVAIRIDINQNDRAVGINFRRREQLSGDVIWSVFETVA